MQGYDADHPNIELLRLRNYTTGRKLTEEEVVGPNSLDRITSLFSAMKPFVSVPPVVEHAFVHVNDDRQRVSTLCRINACGVCAITSLWRLHLALPYETKSASSYLVEWMLINRRLLTSIRSSCQTRSRMKMMQILEMKRRRRTRRKASKKTIDLNMERLTRLLFNSTCSSLST